MKIKIDPEFRDLIPPLSEVELKQLHDNISFNGCLTPLVVWKEEGILLDGHNRYAFCKECDYEYDVKELKFPSREQAKDWIILNQLGRRNVSPDVAADLRGRLYINRKKANGDRGPQKLDQNEPAFSTAEIVARETGVSAATIKRDAAYAEACDKLGITIAAIATGKEKRSRKEIIATAFPEKAKPKKTKAPEPEPITDDDDDVECLVVDETGNAPKDDQWEILFDYFKTLPTEQQQLLCTAIKTYLEK
ncbi:MAG: hypothetical protein KGQ87_03880 [Verrucomicrobia bacterium]|nr:hypothetical protein [Verrucomicrobiota bacterium]